MKNEDVRRNMGEEIRKLRTEQKITQLELSERAGITRANLSNIEAGKYNVSLDTLSKIAKALGRKVKLI